MPADRYLDHHALAKQRRRLSRQPPTASPQLANLRQFYGAGPCSTPATEVCGTDLGTVAEVVDPGAPTARSRHSPAGSPARCR
ncbi:hypothetical protein D2E42_20170 [Mycobacteroides abscessus]|nr:hypothetical protein DDK10_14200 [Mycobacteroides abscessus]RIR69615.1 hypothetical protein D2E42_20170 [Mycobacteroides abscessus]